LIVLIHWGQKFETGITEIDREHRHLVDLTNSLSAALEKPEPHILQSVFMQLAGYICHHLVSEETLAAHHRVDAGLQQRLQHEHQLFVAEIGRLQKQMESDPVHTAQALQACLKDFINNHVLVTDFELAAALPKEHPQHHHEASEAAHRIRALKSSGN
jgi:hemerythrin-like metal-binding protein